MFLQGPYFSAEGGLGISKENLGDLRMNEWMYALFEFLNALFKFFLNECTFSPSEKILLKIFC